MARHLEDCHDDVAEIATMPSKGEAKKSAEKRKQRDAVLDKYRNMGDFSHNLDTLLKKKGVLYVGRRPPTTDKLLLPQDYLPCQFCLVFYIGRELWRHSKKCNYRKNPIKCENAEQEKIARKSSMSAGKLLLQGALGEGSTDFQLYQEEFQEHILDRLMSDEVSRAIKSDSLILLLGRTQFSKLGTARAAQVREKLRIISRLKIQLRSNTGNASACIGDFITSDKYDTCVLAVKTLAGVLQEKSLSGTETFNKPSLALKAGQLLKKVAELKKGQAVRRRDLEAKSDVSDFIDLYETEFKDSVSSLAHQTLSERKYNKKDILPLTADLIKLTKYMEDRIQYLMSVLEKDAMYKIWKELAEVVLARLICFNKRRSNEPSAMLVDKFKFRPNWKTANADLLNSLQPLEKHLLQKIDLVEVLGKKNKKVPVLMTPKLTAAVNLLISTRTEIGIPSCNVYIFAKVNFAISFSTNTAHYLYRCYLWFYRLQEDVIEMAKISKLLLVVEKGKAHTFSGMSVDDIRLEDLYQDLDEQEKEIDGQPVDVVQNLIEQQEETVGQPVNVVRIAQEEETDGQPVNVVQNLIEQSEETVGQPVNVVRIAQEEETGQPEMLVDGSFERTLAVVQRKRKAAKDCGINLKKYKFDSGSSCEESADEYDPRKDKDTDTESELEPVHLAPRKASKQKRTKWTEKERLAVKKYLVPNVQLHGKPPTKQEILKAKILAPELSDRLWKTIKYQAWAMYNYGKKKRQQLSSRLLQK